MAIDLNELATALGQIILRFRVRRNTAAAWAASDEVLLDAEIGLETDTDQFKFGDGLTPWSTLAYYGSDSSTGLGPANAGAGIKITPAAPGAELNAMVTIIQAAAHAAVGNKQVVWVKWFGYPTSDSDWTPAQGTTFTLYASRRGSDDSGTGAVLVYGQLTLSAGITYTPDDTTRYNVVGGVTSGAHASLVGAAVTAGVDIQGFHRADNNLPSNACATWADAPIWANWAFTLPLGQPGVVQPNPGNGQPAPDYSEWALYGTSLPADPSAPAGSIRAYYAPTTSLTMDAAAGFIKTVPADVPQITQVTFGRSIGGGIDATVNVNSTVYTYESPDAQSNADALTALAAGINADATGIVTASISSGNLILTGKTVAVAYTVTASSQGRVLKIINTAMGGGGGAGNIDLILNTGGSLM